MMVIRRIPATVFGWEHANYSMLNGGLTLGSKHARLHNHDDVE